MDATTIAIAGASTAVASPLVGIAVLRSVVAGLKERATEDRKTTSKSLEKIEENLRREIAELKAEKADKVVLDAFVSRVDKLEDHLAEKFTDLIDEIRKINK